jgi:hypothetical protein
MFGVQRTDKDNRNWKLHHGRLAAALVVIALLAAGVTSEARGASAPGGSPRSGVLAGRSGVISTPESATRPHQTASRQIRRSPLNPGSSYGVASLTGSSAQDAFRLRSSSSPRSAATGGPYLGQQWAGSSSAEVEPADVQIGVGQTDVVEMTNAGVSVWTKTGQSVYSASLGSFFSSTNFDRSNDFVSDPRVVYDPSTARWFSLIFDVTQGQTVLRISDGEDPTGSSYLYWFSSTGCPDQPRLAVSNTIVAFTDNYFTACNQSGLFLGGELTVLDKATLLSQASVQPTVFGPDGRFSAITPATPLTASDSMYLVASDYINDAVDLFELNSSAPTSVPFQYVPVSAITRPPAATESDASLVDSGDYRVQDAMYLNGSVWLSFTDGCTVTGEAGNFSCARYVQINPASLTATTDYEMALDSNRFAFYPQVLPTPDGHILSVFGYSSSSEAPGIGYIEDPQNASSWNFLTRGSGPNDSGRWGDYFGIAADPSAPNHVWIAAAYGAGGNNWGTTIAELSENSTSQALTVSTAGTGNGTITSNPAGISCGTTCSGSFNYGTTVTLTATPSTGSTFSGWSGACSGNATCAVTMTAARSVTADFTAKQQGPPSVACVVPMIKGKGLGAAKRAIKTNHCGVGKIRRAYSARVKRGRVISQTPGAGRQLKRGAKVNIVVSKGSRGG